MSFEILRKLLATQMKDNWTATELDRIVYGRNREGLTVNADNPSWVRLRYSIFNTENAEIGTGFQRSTGIITVECYTPFGTGDKLSKQLTDNATLAFQNKNFSGVQCLAATPIEVGRVGESFQVNLRIDFKYDVFS